MWARRFQWSPRRAPGAVAVGILFVAAVGFLFVDYVSVSGRVIDTDSRPLAGSHILITISGDRPYLPWPHSNRRNAVCLKSYVLVTDEHGRFDLADLTWNSPFINKRMSLVVVSAGRMPQTITQTTTSSIFGSSSEISARLLPTSARRVTYQGDANAPLERTRSETFAALQRAIRQSKSCGGAGSQFLIAVLDQMSEIAISDEERSLVLAYCRDLKEEPKCNNSLFPSVVHRSPDR
jgi:hypothetical protein